MASIALRSKSHSLILKPYKTLFISSRFCSSSSSNDDEYSPEKPINFSDKNPKSDQQPQQSSSSGSSFDEIRKNLSQFTRRSPESQMPNTIRNLNAKNAAEQNPNSPKKGGISIDSIRKTLRMMKDNQPKTTNNANDQFSLNKYRDSLKSTPPSSSSSPLSLATEKKDGIFNTGGGRGGVIGGSLSNLPGTMIGTKKEEGEDVDEESKYRLIRLYSHEDLGQKLRELRPNSTNISTVSKKGKEGEGSGYSFSLSELQQRLGKLKAAEEANVASQSGNVPFDELRMVLGKMELKKDQKWKTAEKLDTFHPKSSPPKEHLIEKYFHPDNMSSAEKLKIELKKVRDEFKMSETDCGSTRVQIAQLTTEIHHLSSVLAKKDKHSRRGLIAKVQKRKKLLKYLRRTDWDSYCFVLSKLGLRDNTDYKNL